MDDELKNLLALRDLYRRKGWFFPSDWAWRIDVLQAEMNNE